MTTRITTTIAAVAAGLVLVGGAVALSPASADAFPLPAAGPTAAPKTASAELAETLRFAKEEERMARDLYQLFADTYGQARPFSMIVRSETQHMTAVDRLLTTYAVADPAAGKVAGVYSVQEIQDLYDAWKSKGLSSVVDAEQVGVMLETRDIADLEQTIAKTSEADVVTVLQRLLAGSRSHLAAFQAAVDNALPTQPAGTNRPSAAPGAAQAGPRNGAGMGTPAGVDADGDGVCDVTGLPVGTGPGAGTGPQSMRSANPTGVPQGQGPRWNR